MFSSLITILFCWIDLLLSIHQKTQLGVGLKFWDLPRPKVLANLAKRLHYNWRPWKTIPGFGGVPHAGRTGICRVRRAVHDFSRVVIAQAATLLWRPASGGCKYKAGPVRSMCPRSLWRRLTQERCWRCDAVCLWNGSETRHTFSLRGLAIPFPLTVSCALF